MRAVICQNPQLGARYLGHSRPQPRCNFRFFIQHSANMAAQPPPPPPLENGVRVHGHHVDLRINANLAAKHRNTTSSRIAKSGKCWCSGQPTIRKHGRTNRTNTWRLKSLKNTHNVSTCTREPLLRQSTVQPYIFRVPGESLRLSTETNTPEHRGHTQRSGEQGREARVPQ